MHVVELDFHFWGGLLLFLLLMLEIADRVVMKRDLQIAREIQTLGCCPALRRRFREFRSHTSRAPRTRWPATTTMCFRVPGKPTKITASYSPWPMSPAKASPAAMLLMVTCSGQPQNAFHAAQVALPELVANMNKYACSNSQGGLRFTTAFLAEYDASGRVFTYINAGHNNPTLRRSTGSIERLDVGGLPLGIMPEAKYESASVAPCAWRLAHGVYRRPSGSGQRP